MENRWTSPRAWLVAAACVASAVPQTPSREQQPTFRATVDMVAVDVQGVDKNGNPLSALNPGNFEVTIDGKKRRIVSASFISSGPAPAGALKPINPGATATNVWPTTDGQSGRTFILAVDAGSFDAGENARVLQAAR